MTAERALLALEYCVIEQAVAAILEQGYRTYDSMEEGKVEIGSAPATVPAVGPVPIENAVSCVSRY
jgi:hypothetical protein